jgi:hypothetical protein
MAVAGRRRRDDLSGDDGTLLVPLPHPLSERALADVYPLLARPGGEFVAPGPLKPKCTTAPMRKVSKGPPLDRQAATAD